MHRTGPTATLQTSLLLYGIQNDKNMRLDVRSLRASLATFTQPVLLALHQRHWLGRCLLSSGTLLQVRSHGLARKKNTCSIVRITRGVHELGLNAQCWQAGLAYYLSTPEDWLISKARCHDVDTTACHILCSTIVTS